MSENSRLEQDGAEHSTGAYVFASNSSATPFIQ